MEYAEMKYRARIRDAICSIIIQIIDNGDIDYDTIILLGKWFESTTDEEQDRKVKEIIKNNINQDNLQ